MFVLFFDLFFCKIWCKKNIWWVMYVIKMWIKLSIGWLLSVMWCLLKLGLVDVESRFCFVDNC